MGEAGEKNSPDCDPPAQQLGLEAQLVCKSQNWLEGCGLGGIQGLNLCEWQSDWTVCDKGMKMGKIWIRGTEHDNGVNHDRSDEMRLLANPGSDTVCEVSTYWEHLCCHQRS